MFYCVLSTSRRNKGLEKLLINTITMKTSIRFITVLLALICCRNGAAQIISAPLNIGITEKFYSKILHEDRKINIYLPENYNFKDTLKYPVILIPDGGIEEDFIHIAGIVRYYTQPWIARFPKSIVVGIENTNRKRDFTFAVTNLDFLQKNGYKKEAIAAYGGSGNYIAFLKNELMPYLHAKYRAGLQRTVIGESLAGLLATEILLAHTDMFDNYIIVSPSLWWNDGSLLKQKDKIESLDNKVKVYIGAPNESEDKKMFADAKTLYSIASQNKHITAFFDHISDEYHATVFHQAVYNGFKKLYPL